MKIMLNKSFGMPQILQKFGIINGRINRCFVSDQSLAEKMQRLAGLGLEEDKPRDGQQYNEDEEDSDRRRFIYETDEKGEPFRSLYIQPNRISPLREKLEFNARKMEQLPFVPITGLQGTRRPRSESMSPEQDWPSVWPAAASFKPSVVPLPLRMGYTKKGSKNIPPDKWLNLELVKIPNFLHLTPEHIRRHCSAIKKYCTKWPTGLQTDTEMDRFFPLRVSYSDYVHAGTSLRDTRCRIVTTEFQLTKTFRLDERAYDKFVRLCGHRHDQKTDTVTIVTDRCFTRKQNLDYAIYLLTALYQESMKVEPWEKLKDKVDDRWIRFENSNGQQKIMDIIVETAKNIDDQDPEKIGIPVASRELKSGNSDPKTIIKEHETVMEYAKVWEEYRNRPETLDSARDYGRSIRQLLNIPPLSDDTNAAQKIN